MKFNVLNIIFLVLLAFSLFGQNARNGYWLTNTDTIRVFVVYAEVVNDPFDIWPELPALPKGQMPQNTNSLFDNVFDPSNIEGYVTNYFYQASFGKLVVIGDYYPTLIRVPYNQLIGYGDTNIVNILNNVQGDIITSQGFSIMAHNFDLWSFPNEPGMPKLKWPDNMIDVMMIVWRTNSKISLSSNAGMMECNKWMYPLKNKNGFNDIGKVVSRYNNAGSIVRHELSHSLLGGNSMHAGGSGGGQRWFMADVGGYGMLSSWNSISDSWNAWDRHRLGWKNPNNQYFISSRWPGSNKEINSDFVYGQSFPNGVAEFILRDFVSTGDAIRIMLPHTSRDVPSQYLWLENRQLNKEYIDHTSPRSKGIYAYLQIGKDDFSDFLGNNSYLYPLTPVGNYDIELIENLKPLPNFEILNNGIVNLNYLDVYRISEKNKNPFTGLNHLMLIPDDYNKVDGLKDVIYTNEVLTIRRLLIEEDIIANHEVMYNNPCFGTPWDAFKKGDIISMNTNPAPVTIATYTTPYPRPISTYIYSEDYKPNFKPMLNDNRNIYLNGLYIEVVEEYDNGDIKVKIKFDDFTVNNNVRWCGDIVLNEKLIIDNNSSVKIDLGKTPSHPSNPIVHKGKKYFSRYSSFTSNIGSELIIKSGSKLEFDENSSFVLMSGAKLVIEEGAELIIKENSSFIIEAGANVLVYGKIIIDENSKILSKGGHIRLVNEMSRLVLHGALVIDKNSAFRVSGKGLTRIKPSNYYSYNPYKQFSSAGNSHLTFSGVGINNVMLVVESNKINFSGIENIYFENGLVQYAEPECGINIFQEHGKISIVNTKFNNLYDLNYKNKGLQVFGKSTIEVYNSVFLNSLYGLRLFPRNGYDININIENSHFNNCYNGLWATQSNIYINNSFFTNNYFGLNFIEILKHNVEISASFISSNNVGIQALGGNRASLRIYDTKINNNSHYGILFLGGWPIIIECSEINENGNAGIVAGLGALVVLNSETYYGAAGNTMVVDNPMAILLLDAYDLVLRNGNNYILPKIHGAYNTIKGSLFNYSMVENHINFANNQWNSDGLPSGNFEFLLFSTYYLNPISVTANPIKSYSGCVNSKFMTDNIITEGNTYSEKWVFKLNNSSESELESVWKYRTKKYNDLALFATNKKISNSSYLKPILNQIICLIKHESEVFNNYDNNLSFSDNLCENEDFILEDELLLNKTLLKTDLNFIVENNRVIINNINANQNYIISLTTIDNKLIYSKKIISLHDIELDFNYLASGIYLLSLVDDSGRAITKKITIIN